jgi:dihydropyrimidinase
MIYDYLIQNGSLVYPEKTVKADVGIKDTKLHIFAERKKVRAERIIDASECFILPGLIDAHIHPVYVDDLEQVARTAAFGGVTAMLHYITVKPGRSMTEVLTAAREQGEKTSALDFGFHAALCDTLNQLRDIPAAVKMGVSSFKMFTAYKKLNMLTDDYALSAAMDVIGAHGGMASVHAENGPVIDYLEEKARSSGKNMHRHFLQTSPSLLDKEAIFRVLCIGKIMDCPVFLPHISSQHALEALELGLREGARFYAETCPHYLVFTWKELQRQGPLGKIRPPVKDDRDRQALWQAVESRFIHTIGSDHAPKNKHKTDDFDASPYGAPGTETILPLLWDKGVNKNRLTPNRLVELTAENPARIFGLFPRKGRLSTGADADLVVFNPRTTWVISRGNQHSRAPYTLYEGLTCNGRVEKVFAGGQLVVDGDVYLGQPGRGRFLKTRITRGPL